ncbi:uncharacterized protein LOC129757552 [Uranotaenia lowii]|uniref:uncharacterized protein LOC129757552 n=1 Tax=Uranotaenia lowii TaxID=190385 RepID=UPI0024789547|nr:uncharacterized protein LOC129757552 [Uranotaenia lowii]
MNFNLLTKLFAFSTLFCIQSSVALECFQCDSIETCNENRPAVTCNDENVSKTAAMAETIFPGIYNNITDPVYWCIHARVVKTSTGSSEQVHDVKGCIKEQWMGFCNNEPATDIKLEECWSCYTDQCNGSRRSAIDQTSAFLIVFGGLITTLLMKR